MNTSTDPQTDRTHEDATLAARFLRFAGTDCPPGELYDALCRSAAGEASVLRLLRVAAPEQRRPNLLLAALHGRRHLPPRLRRVPPRGRRMANGWSGIVIEGDGDMPSRA